MLDLIIEGVSTVVTLISIGVTIYSIYVTVNKKS